MGALIEIPRELAFSPGSPPLVDTMRSWQSVTQNRVLTRSQGSQPPDLGLLASRSMRNKFLLFICHAMPGAFIIAALAG